MKDKLIRTAERLAIPGPEAIREFRKLRSSLSEECTRIFEQRSDIKQLIRDNNLAMAKDNNRNFARFMESIFTDFEPTLLVETVLWVFEAYRTHGFQTTYWAANLNIWVDVLKSRLSEKHFSQIYPLYNWFIINIPVFTLLTDHAVNDSPSSSTGNESR